MGYFPYGRLTVMLVSLIPAMLVFIFAGCAGEKFEEGAPVPEAPTDPSSVSLESCDPTPTTESAPETAPDPLAGVDLNLHPTSPKAKLEPDPAPEPPPSPESDSSGEDYVTDILLYSDGFGKDFVLPVARHAAHSDQNKLIATAAMATPDGDFFQVGADFLWQTQSANIATFVSMDYTMDNVVYASGNADLFDLDLNQEPIAEASVCVKNTCPKSLAAFCPTVVCKTFSMAGVVDVSGKWVIHGGEFDGDSVLKFSQEGREFRGEPQVKRGLVLHKTVSFEHGDYLYVGYLAWDRNQMNGLVWELMTLSVVGTFSASRINPIED